VVEPAKEVTALAEAAPKAIGSTPWENPTSALALLSLVLARQPVKEDEEEEDAPLPEGSSCIYEAANYTTRRREPLVEEALAAPALLEMWDTPIAALALLGLALDLPGCSDEAVVTRLSTYSKNEANEACVGAKSLTMESIDTGVPSSASDDSAYSDASFSRFVSDSADV
jgi:hypothetical protein